jgi:hypothetical protein
VIIIRCLNCAHCCYWFNVAIVRKECIDEIKSEEDINEKTVIIKEHKQFCEHLKYNEETNKFTCSIHHYPWFKFTPCHQFTQIEEHDNSPCRIGEWYQLEGRDYYDSFLMKNWREHNETKADGRK